MKNKESKNKNGFSLLELLVVILIIGILAAVALPQYQLAVFKARFAALMDVTNAIYQAEERYYMIWDKYTSDLSQLDMSLECELSDNKKYCTYDWGVCEVYVSSAGYEKVTCLNTVTLKNGYSRFFRTHWKGEHRVCLDFEENHTNLNSRYNRICKEFGGRLDFADGNQALSSGNRRSSSWYL